MKISKLYPLLVASALLFGGTAIYAPPMTAQVTQVSDAGTIDWTKGQITVTGSGAAPNGANQTAGQKRLLAQRAAVGDAYRQLAELINGVRVDSETVVENYVTTSDIVRTRVSALVKGAKIGTPRFMSDGTVEIDVTIGLYGSNSLSSVIIPPAIQQNNVPVITQPSTIPTARPTPDSTIPTTNGFTGVIVDCTGLGVEPAMSPRIVDTNGTEIYIGSRPIDPDHVVNVGIVGYAESLAKAKSNARVGNNPLIIRASRAGGKHKTDAVVGADLGRQILGADQGGNFLTQSKVIFVVDKD